MEIPIIIEKFNPSILEFGNIKDTWINPLKIWGKLISTEIDKIENRYLQKTKISINNTSHMRYIIRAITEEGETIRAKYISKDKLLGYITSIEIDEENSSCIFICSKISTYYKYDENKNSTISPYSNRGITEKSFL
ncbi:hypothetical protein [Candidatus Fokinia crypta]|uniref:Uncharacterized protein n=1 Tax=Candidatus Fokinia crypta TaxID=1920990 RepID=A0ABZ0UNA8_9RICK|nr:hypothetical protein [Candidatus Fokinia cryptica]WPX97601.1 hypothetical protein Fokcrypt_00107 [Candidatus Fokinia cryptica]